MKVTIVSTKGVKVTKLESTAQTWGELQTELSTASIPFGGMKAIIGQTQVTLESSKAILPDFDFTLFLTPIKVKSGNMTRPELYTIIQKFRAENPTKKDLFNKYSSLSTVELNKLVKEHIKSDSKVSSTDITEEVKTNIETPVTNAALELIKQQLANIESKMVSQTTVNTTAIPVVTPIDEDSIIKKYLLKLQEEETAKLMQEFVEIEKNLK